MFTRRRPDVSHGRAASAATTRARPRTPGGRRARAQVIPFPWARVPVVDSLRAAVRKPYMHALAEIDVTDARQAFARHKERTGESLSFTAFIIGCVAKAVAEHPEVQAYRKGRHHLLVFADVDVCTPIEHAVGGSIQATPYVIRLANRKSFRAIHQEIRAAQAARGAGSRWDTRIRRAYPYLPSFLRTMFWRAFCHFPRPHAWVGGTVFVTAPGMFGKGTGWGITSTSEYSLQVVLGSIAEKPGVVNGAIAIRQYLCVTVSADHDVVDGAPLTRFFECLKELIESSYGLEGVGVPLPQPAAAAPS